jgi:hypothetical protein
MANYSQLAAVSVTHQYFLGCGYSGFRFSLSQAAEQFLSRCQAIFRLTSNGFRILVDEHGREVLEAIVRDTTDVLPSELSLVVFGYLNDPDFVNYTEAAHQPGKSCYFALSGQLSANGTNLHQGEYMGQGDVQPLSQLGSVLALHPLPKLQLCPNLLIELSLAHLFSAAGSDSDYRIQFDSRRCIWK